MTSIAHSFPVLLVSWFNHKHPKLQNSRFPVQGRSFSYPGSHYFGVCCSSSSQWEPASLKYAPDNEGSLLKDASNIFESMTSSGEADAEQRTNTGQVRLDLLRWPLWLLGPVLLLITGVIPTLWLPVSSIFIGPNIASLLSLTGLDCIFNLGASLFLLMADSTARSSNTDNHISNSRPPYSYQFWNMAANVVGFIIPVAILMASEKGLLEPRLPPIAFAVVLAPYLLLLSVQIITEALTWHWRSPVWLVTPVVYEAYRLLQLMRGLKLGSELGAPPWTMHAIRGLVCGWVLVLGVQLMRVAWYAGFTAASFHQKQEGAAT